MHNISSIAAYKNCLNGWFYFLDLVMDLLPVHFRHYYIEQKQVDKVLIVSSFFRRLPGQILRS